MTTYFLPLPVQTAISVLFRLEKTGLIAKVRLPGGGENWKEVIEVQDCCRSTEGRE